MEYGSNLCCPEELIDQNFQRYVGWNGDSLCNEEFFSAKTIKYISSKISEYLKGVDPQNRKIVVSDNNIINVMNSINENYRPQTGDIFGRYNIPNRPIDHNQEMINQTINLIVNDVKNNLETEENNKKLTIWTTVYGDFNEQGLRSHPPIKIRNKKPASMQFNMNY
jgi:hypothetical protein